MNRLWTGCEQDVNGLWTGLWTGCEQVVNRLWTGCEQTVNRMWTGCEQVVNRLWTGREQANTTRVTRMNQLQIIHVVLNTMICCDSEMGSISTKLIFIFIFTRHKTVAHSGRVKTYKSTCVFIFSTFSHRTLYFMNKYVLTKQQLLPLAPLGTVWNTILFKVSVFYYLWQKLADVTLW